MKFIFMAIIILPSWAVAFENDDYEVTKTVAYSITALKVIEAVETKDEKFQNFIECDLIKDKDGNYEGYSAANCKFISGNWLQKNSTESVDLFNAEFNEHIDLGVRGDIGSRLFIISVSTIMALAGADHLKTSILYRQYQMGRAVAVGSLTLIGGLAGLAAGLYFSLRDVPSIETILEDEEFVDDLESLIGSDVYNAIREALKHAINKSGIALMA